jgi:hypothetical protein
MGAGGTGGTGGTGSASCSAGGAGGSSDKADYATMRLVVTTCGGPGCHNDSTQPTLVDDANLYATLTTYKSALCGGRVLVKRCAPEESAFYLAQKGECGAGLPQMPLGCVDLCTPPDYLEGIRQWIAKGAPQ